MDGAKDQLYQGGCGPSSYPSSGGESLFLSLFFSLLRQEFARFTCREYLASASSISCQWSNKIINKETSLYKVIFAIVFLFIYRAFQYKCIPYGLTIIIVCFPYNENQPNMPNAWTCMNQYWKWYTSRADADTKRITLTHFCYVPP